MMFSKRQKLSPCNDENLPRANFQSPGTTATPTSISTPTPQEWPQYSPSQAGDTAPFHSSPLGSRSWYQDEFTHDPGYLASQEELRCMLFSIAQSAVPGSSGSDVDLYGGGTRLSPSGVMKEALSNRRRIGYLKNYVGEVAPWLDMFDTQCVFRMQIPVLASNFPALLYAVLAISARQMERKEGIQDSFESLELYQEAIRILSPLLQVRDPKVIAACVLLCCLEMMSARAQDWRRHLEGCAALFDAFGIHGFSDGLLQAVFWCYARMDLCGALISDGTQSTLLKPSKWLTPGWHDHEASRLFQEHRSPDMHANYAVYLCARACELVADRTKCVELGEHNGCTKDVFQDRWIQLWEEMENWFVHRPSELLPVQTTNTKPFPHILFLHWAAISSNQLCHTASILLLNTAPKNIKLQQAPTTSALWHARRICGISLANPHQGCLNNAIQPLWVAGRLFSHSSEHRVIVDLIKNIEAGTGWGVCWRIKDLEHAWGYRISDASVASPTVNFRSV